MNVATANYQNTSLTADSFVTELPWSSSVAENKRFTVITAIVLCITLIFAGLIKLQELPERPRAEKEKVPAQLTRIMAPRKVEPPKPKPIPKPEPKPIEPEPKKPTPEPKKEQPKPKKEPVKPTPTKVKTPTKAEITEQAKAKAQQSGVLAFQDDLASLRDNNSFNNLADTDTIKGAGASDQTQRKFVGKKVAGGSGGVDTSQLTSDIGAKGELKGTKTTEYVAPTEGLASIAAKQLEVADQVLGSRDIESIRKTLDANKGAIYAIYRRALRSDPSLEGKLTVNLTIEPNGSVSDIKLVFSELESATLEGKLLNRIKLINFGEQAVTQTLLDYSFNFLPF
ncbi:AgmX/PglI C-terminal domain-containing protein [Paraglaciecola sp. 2405UD69-4]|uniref:AgmX/PglI C-terminal domain-containing protein n=1 Tax=Paraglaciecola sp. 2405UD69-4 TaxID=3391836 RepID=UPI0039C926D0